MPYTKVSDALHIMKVKVALYHLLKTAARVRQPSVQHSCVDRNLIISCLTGGGGAYAASAPPPPPPVSAPALDQPNCSQLALHKEQDHPWPSQQVVLYLYLDHLH